MFLSAGLFSSKAHKRRSEVHAVVCLELFSPSLLLSAQRATPYGSPKAQGLCLKAGGLQGG